MSLNESIVEDALRRVNGEIGRVKFREPFPISLLPLPISSHTLLRDTLLLKLLSGELSVTALDEAVSMA